MKRTIATVVSAALNLVVLLLICFVAMPMLFDAPKVFSVILLFSGIVGIIWAIIAKYWKMEPFVRTMWMVTSYLSILILFIRWIFSFV